MIRGKYLEELPLWNYSSRNKKITLREIVDRKTINYCLKISNEILNSKDFIFLKKIFNKNLIQLHLAYFLYYDTYYSICDLTILKNLKKKKKAKILSSYYPYLGKLRYSFSKKFFFKHKIKFILFTSINIISRYFNNLIFRDNNIKTKKKK